MTLSTNTTKPPRHTLPRHGAPVDARNVPFVGNDSVADNLLECAQVAIWNALGPASSRVELGIEGAAIRAAGHVQSREDREAAVQAVARAIAPAQLIDHLSVEAGEHEHVATPTAAGAPIVRVRRFCSLTDASLSAAIGSALERLDELSADGVAAPERVAVVYRNRGTSTMTIDVGYLTDFLATSVDDDIQNDRLPGGPELSVFAEAGVAGLLAAQTALLGNANAAEHTAVWWQVFSANELRQANGLPATQLHLALHSATGVTAPRA